ncbi:hypothetical protein JCM1841_004473 [Sporobolomyces salmonicolor]
MGLNMSPLVARRGAPAPSVFHHVSPPVRKLRHRPETYDPNPDVSAQLAYNPSLAPKEGAADPAGGAGREVQNSRRERVRLSHARALFGVWECKDLKKSRARGEHSQWASLDALVATSTTAPTSLAHLLQRPSHVLPAPSGPPSAPAEPRKATPSSPPPPSNKRDSKVDTASARPPPAPAAKRPRKSTARPAAGEEESTGKRRGRTPRASRMAQREKVKDQGPVERQVSAAASEEAALTARPSPPAQVEIEPSAVGAPVPASRPVSGTAAARRSTAASDARRPPPAQNKRSTGRRDASRKLTVATSRPSALSPPRPAAEPAPPAFSEPDEQLAASSTNAASKKQPVCRKPAAPARPSPPAPPSATTKVNPPASGEPEASTTSEAAQKKRPAGRSRKPAARACPPPPSAPVQEVAEAAPLSSRSGEIDPAFLPVELPSVVPRASVPSTSNAPVPLKETKKKADPPPAVAVKPAAKRPRARKQVEQVEPAPEPENSAPARPPPSKRARLSPPAPRAKKTNLAPPPPLPPTSDVSSASSSPAPHSSHSQKSKSKPQQTRIRTSRLEGNHGRLNVFDVLVGRSDVVLAQLMCGFSSSRSPPLSAGR